MLGKAHVWRKPSVAQITPHYNLTDCPLQGVEKSPLSSITWHYRLHGESSPVLWSLPPVEDDIEPAEVKQRRLEAILLLSREPLPSRRLAGLAGLADATEARTLIRRINDRYDRQGRAFRIEEVAGGFLLLSRPQFAPWLRRLGYVPQEERLTQPALETLAVVAYRQPVQRADIEAIRGVGCDEVLRQLIQRDLVRICGRSEDLGRPYLYGTTKRFLQMFGLRSVDRLPRAEWINQPWSSDWSSEPAD